MEERIKVIAETIKDMIIRGDLGQAVTTASEMHSADAADVLDCLDINDQVEIIKNLEPRTAALILLEMEDQGQVEIAERLKTGELRDVLASMPVDEAVDLLGDIPGDQRGRLFRLFGREEAGEFRELLKYPDDTAGGLMTPDFMFVHPTDTVGRVIEMIRSAPMDIETIYYVYVLSEENILKGVLSLREIIVSPVNRIVGDMISKEIVSLSPDEDQEKVAEVISKYNLLAVPVVDGDGKMIGLVTVDDVMDVIEDEAEEDIMRFAGATGVEEDMKPGLLYDISRRLPWFLLAAVVEILVAGGILKLYSSVMTDFIVLVFFLPLLVIMGGNIAVQSSAITGHWLSTGGTFGKNVITAVMKELIWGIIIGALTGVAVGLLAYLFDKNISVGVVVGLSLMLTVIAASGIGCALPVFLRWIGRDPGAAPGPLIGTTMDVVSLGIYLGIGLMLIK